MDYLSHLYGLLIGVAAFFTIGIFHPIVAKAEYYFGKKIWWVFFILGIVFSVSSIFIQSTMGSVLLGTIGFSSFWSTHEIFKQHYRVIRGQAKRNPNRAYSVCLTLIPMASISHLNFKGVIIGSATFLIIAFSRYICIKAEYYFTKRFWVVFLIIGLVSIVFSVIVSNLIWSIILGINGFTFLWGIGEIIEQEERVNKGWFPQNPKRAVKDNK